VSLLKKVKPVITDRVVKVDAAGVGKLTVRKLWQAEIDSHDPAAPAGAAARSAGDEVTLGPRSVAVLRTASPR
jgi:hypothetical protein